MTQNRERLRSLGFDVDGFADVVTSGEATWQLMKHRPHAPWDRLGRRCYLLTHLRDMEVVQGLDLELVSDVADAEFIFASGLEPSSDWRTCVPWPRPAWPAACR